ncbi:MAG: histidine phosphatase family protein [Candidatus Moduliflexus flocculans]|nr:histidine phosphatase family protein [Candidatus Moduliflexus flocculans]
MPVQTTISTMRHAHTQYNAEKRYAGTIDIPLSREGERDTRKAAAKLAGAEFDVVVTSTQKRAYETAQILVGEKVPIVRNKLCNERRFGVMEGLTWDDIQNLDPPILMISVGHDLHTVNPKGGEPFEEVWDRAKKFRRFLFEQVLRLERPGRVPRGVPADVPRCAPRPELHRIPGQLSRQSRAGPVPLFRPAPDAGERPRSVRGRPVQMVARRPGTPAQALRRQDDQIAHGVLCQVGQVDVDTSVRCKGHLTEHRFSAEAIKVDPDEGEGCRKLPAASIISS